MATAKKKIVIVQMQKKLFNQSPERIRKGEGGERERVHLCLDKFSHIEAKQVLFLIVPTRHRSAVWKSGYTSLQQTEHTVTLTHILNTTENNEASRTKFNTIIL